MPATNSSRDARMVPIAAEAAPTRRAGQIPASALKYCYRLT